jgi:hypothetical protein
MSDLIAGATPRQLARTYGVLSLTNILLGAFALGYVPSIVGGSGDPSATLHNIQAHELLYRLGLVAHIIVTTTNVGLALITYELFKVVNRRLAILSVFLVLIATAVEAAAILADFAPLVLLDGARHSGAFTPGMLQALTYTALGLSNNGYSVYTIFYGLDFLIPTSILLYTAKFLPRFFGPLLAIDGVAYLFNAFASILAPAFAASLVPYILLPILVCEGSLTVWFLIFGVDNEKWAQVAAAR